jgi:hypothetical protein
MRAGGGRVREAMPLSMARDVDAGAIGAARVANGQRLRAMRTAGARVWLREGAKGCEIFVEANVVKETRAKARLADQKATAGACGSGPFTLSFRANHAHHNILLTPFYTHTFQ